MKYTQKSPDLISQEMMLESIYPYPALSYKMPGKGLNPFNKMSSPTKTMLTRAT